MKKPRTMKTIAVANQKGGVGKTTLARNLAFFAIERGLRTLCVDFDPQKNFSKTLRAFRERNLDASTENAESLNASHLFKAATRKPLMPLECGAGAALIAADHGLEDVASMPLKSMLAPRAMLAKLANDFDVCVIDTAPGIGNPLLAGLIAADFVICPCTMDQDAIDGLNALFENIARVQQVGWNSSLVLLGLLANKVNTRRAFDRNALEQLRRELGDVMLDTVLYDRAATQYAKDRPVWRGRSGESQILAAKEMKAVCCRIFKQVNL